MPVQIIVYLAGSLVHVDHCQSWDQVSDDDEVEETLGKNEQIIVETAFASHHTNISQNDHLIFTWLIHVRCSDGLDDLPMSSNSFKTFNYFPPAATAIIVQPVLKHF